MSSEKRSTRNGKVEFLRLVFCLCVFGTHAVTSIGIKGKTVFGALPFQHGRLGVEFFFLLSGFFLAAAAKKLYESGEELSIGRETWRFTLKKVNAVLPYHLLLFPLTLIVRFCLKNFTNVLDAGGYLIKSVPNLFLFVLIGPAESRPLADEWYIAKMLLAGFMLFPLLLKFKKKFARIVCPIAAILLVDYMMYTTGMLGGTSDLAFGGAVSKTLVRAVAEMALGIFCYEAVDYLKRCKLDRRWIRVAATVLEAVLYLFCLYFVFAKDPMFEAYFLFFAAAGLVLSLSEVSYGKTLFNRKVFYFAGEISLPLYLSQRVVFVFFENTKLLSALSHKMQFAVLFAIVLALALLARWAAKGVAKLVKRAEAAVLPEEDARVILR